MHEFKAQLCSEFAFTMRYKKGSCELCPPRVRFWGGIYPKLIKQNYTKSRGGPGAPRAPWRIRPVRVSLRRDPEASLILIPSQRLKDLAARRASILSTGIYTTTTEQHARQSPPAPDASVPEKPPELHSSYVRGAQVQAAANGGAHPTAVEGGGGGGSCNGRVALNHSLL